MTDYQRVNHMAVLLAVSAAFLHVRAQLGVPADDRAVHFREPIACVKQTH
jgi:hypothetical protein